MVTGVQVRRRTVSPIFELAVVALVVGMVMIGGRACSTGPQSGDIQVGADAGLHYWTPPDGGIPPWYYGAVQPVDASASPHLCVALNDAGQACLEAESVDHAYRLLFDAVLASPHGYRRKP